MNYTIEKYLENNFFVTKRLTIKMLFNFTCCSICNKLFELIKAV